MANQMSVLRISKRSDGVSHVLLSEAVSQVAQSKSVPQFASRLEIVYALCVGQAIETEDYLFQQWAECDVLECA